MRDLLKQISICSEFHDKTKVHNLRFLIPLEKSLIVTDNVHIVPDARKDSDLVKGVLPVLISSNIRRCPFLFLISMLSVILEDLIIQSLLHIEEFHLL